MQRIETLQEGVGLPLAISPSATDDARLPPAVADWVKRGRLWHLVVWSDDEADTVGLWHKGLSIVVRRGELDGRSLEVMRRAKGPGWVALEAKVQGQRQPIPLLQAEPFNSDALAWLLQHQHQISQVSDLAVVVSDLGSDY